MNHLEEINAAIEDARVHARASSVAPLLSDLERICRHAQDLASELARMKSHATEDAALDTKWRRVFQNRCTDLQLEQARLLKVLEDFASIVALLVGPKLHVVEGCAVLDDPTALCSGTCAEVHRVLRDHAAEVERALRLAETKEASCEK